MIQLRPCGARSIEVHLRSENDRHDHVSKIPLKYIEKIQIREYQDKLNKEKRRLRVKIWPWYYSPDGAVYPHEADRATHVRIPLSSPVYVRYNPLGRKRNILLSGPHKVTEVIISVTVDKLEIFREYLDEHSIVHI